MSGNIYPGGLQPGGLISGGAYNWGLIAGFYMRVYIRGGLLFRGLEVHTDNF